MIRRIAGFTMIPISVSTLVVVFAVAGGSHDWSQWRGPNRDGKVRGFSPPRQWPAKLTRKWKVDVGTGHSSPLIIGSRVFCISRQGENEVIRCLDILNGKQIWRDSYAAPYEMDPAAEGHGKGPKSTPIYSDGLLFTLGISGILSCLDTTTGKVRWRQEFSKQYPKTSPLYGAAMSPLVDKGKLITHVGGHDKGALTAFDTKTGRAVWRWTGDGPAYTSPIVVDIGGTRQLVSQSQNYCVGVALDTGKLLWRIPFKTPYDQNIVTPVVAGELLIFGGNQQPTFACKVTKSGSRWKAEKAWETRDVTMYMSSPVISGNLMYGLSERRRGQLFSLDVKTGKTRWLGDGRFAENAAILDAGTVLLVLTNEANFFVFGKNANQLVEKARYEIADNPTWASPAIVGKHVLIKDATSLALWDVP